MIDGAPEIAELRSELGRLGSRQLSGQNASLGCNASRSQHQPARRPIYDGVRYTCRFNHNEIGDGPNMEAAAWVAERLVRLLRHERESVLEFVVREHLVARRNKRRAIEHVPVAEGRPTVANVV